MPTIKPQKGPQSKFLASTAEIVVYGGSAGGGKSFGLLMDPLRYLTEVPGFTGVIFRRTYPEIVVPGGLWDTSVELYEPMGAKPRIGALDWTFPPYGNTMSFHHLQHEQNKYNWQGSQITYLGFDELAHFTESSVTYVAFSRGRSQCVIPSYLRCTCNPDPGWVKAFVAPWVDREFPAPAASGEVRYFIREEGKMQWVGRTHPDAKSLTFIRASAYDNPIMLERNPSYIASLKALLPVERARLLDGDWDVRREGLVYPEFGSAVVDSVPGGDSGLVAPDVGGIDFGFSNPFACIWGHLDHDGVLWITGCRYVRQCTLPTHAEAIPRGVRYWCDPAAPELRVELRNAGHDAIPCVHIPGKGASGETRNPKLHGIDLVSERIRTGRLRVVRSACMPLVREMGLYHYPDDKQSEDPVKEDDHACFPAGTIITTNMGNIPIEQMRVGDRVLTRYGWFSVTATGVTGFNKPVRRVKFSDGLSMTGTENHPVWTENREWIPIDALRYGDIMDTVEYSIRSIEDRAWEEQSKRSCSMGSHSAVGPSLGIGRIDSISPRPAVPDSIGRSGSINTDPSLMGMTCTIATATRSTMIPGTWNASVSLSTTPGTTPNGPTSDESGNASTSPESARSPRSGTAARRGGNGTESTGDRPGWVERLARRLASIAAGCLRRRTGGRQLATARASAERMPEKSAASTMWSVPVPFVRPNSRSTPTLDRRPVPVFVVSVSDSEPCDRVYNLTVDGPPEFYANGVLVHNCDALRYLIVGLDRGKAAPPPARDPEPEPPPVERDIDDERYWR